MFDLKNRLFSKFSEIETFTLSLSLIIPFIAKPERVVLFIKYFDKIEDSSLFMLFLLFVVIFFTKLNIDKKTNSRKDKSDAAISFYLICSFLSVYSIAKYLSVFPISNLIDNNYLAWLNFSILLFAFARSTTALLYVIYTSKIKSDKLADYMKDAQSTYLDMAIAVVITTLFFNLLKGQADIIVRIFLTFIYSTFALTLAKPIKVYLQKN